MADKKKTPAKADPKATEAALSKALFPWLKQLAQNQKEVTLTETLFHNLLKPDLPPTFAKLHLNKLSNRSIEQFAKWYVLQENAKSEIRTVSTFVDKKHFSVCDIALFSRVFLTEYRNAFIACQKYEPFWFDDKTILHLANISTAVYLERWLESDRTCRRNIRSFSIYGYGQKTNILSSASDQEANSRALARAYEGYSTLFKYRQSQGKQEHVRPHPTAYKRQSERPVDYITLAWCKAWHNGNLKILHRLMFTKHFINRKSKRDAIQNTVLAQDLSAFYGYIDALDKIYAQSKADPVKAREYVAGCVLLQKLERACRFQLVTQATYYLTDVNQHQQAQSIFPELASAYWGRFSETDDLLFDSIRCYDENYRRKYVRVNESLDVLNYEHQIKQVFQTQDVTQASAEITKEHLKRAAQMDLLALLYTAFPFEQMHAWSDEDFQNAADFYNNDYPIVPSYLHSQPPSFNSNSAMQSEQIHCYYDLYHQQYAALYNFEGSPLKAFLDLSNSKQHRS